MPTDYTCSRCQLSFSVGWYHYHDFSSGYGAKTLMVCAECGTMHAVELAVTDVDLPEGLPERTVSSFTLPPDQLPDRLVAQPAPVFAKPDAPDLNMVSYAEWIACDTCHALRRERTVCFIRTLEGCEDELALEDMRCAHCGRSGSLVSRWPEEGAGCPGCGTLIKEWSSFWIT